MSRKILVVCPFPQGLQAGQRLKYEQYFSHWRANGFEITVVPFMEMPLWKVAYVKGHILKKIAYTLLGELKRLLLAFEVPTFDLVYVFLWVTPFGTSFFERVYRHLAKKLILDVEDNLMIQKGNNVNVLSPFIRAKDKFTYLIRHADHVITSSTFLNEDCLRINENKACTYITSSINVERYVMASRYSNDQTVVIGWTGTFTSFEHFKLLCPVLVELKKHRRFKLLVIGNFEYSFPEMDFEMIQWTKESEIGDLQRMDIGVYPLPVNDWVLGKSGLKALQYMAMGIPAVATDVGSNPLIIRHMENGCLVKSDQDWLEILIRLIDDPALRRRIGMAGRNTIENNYSTEVVKDQYLSVLNQVSN